jgi:glyoxylase-like metal-dependent hydrolase (beta-lactamase superfamily II)
VNGDCEIVFGVRVLSMPSHTVGFQTVLVETRRGPILIASDMLPYFDNWTGRWGLDHIPSGIFEDSLHEYYTCFDRIEEIDPVVVLPGVNPRLAKQPRWRQGGGAAGQSVGRHQFHQRDGRHPLGALLYNSAVVQA